MIWRYYEAGAASVTISGHGPSLLAMTTAEDKAQVIGDAMADVFGAHGTACKVLILNASMKGTLPPAK